MPTMLAYTMHSTLCTSALARSNCLLYADDINIYVTGQNVSAIFNEINEDLIGLQNWYTTNKLTLNLRKTHYIILNNCPKKSNMASLQLATVVFNMLKRINSLGYS